jgi:tetratricopeptide (TPR) repeat protein
MPGAEEAFRKALQLEPELDQAVSGLGVLMVETGRPQETIEFLREFLMDGSPSVRTMMAYARALSATERHSDALEILARAKELAPDNPEIDAEIAKYSESGSLDGLATSGVQTSTEAVMEEAAPEPPEEPLTEALADSITEAASEPRAVEEADEGTEEPPVVEETPAAEEPVPVPEEAEEPAVEPSEPEEPAEPEEPGVPGLEPFIDMNREPFARPGMSEPPGGIFDNGEEADKGSGPESGS